MKSLFVPFQDIIAAVDNSLVPVLGETSWFFVALDSQRGSFLKAREFLSPQLRSEGVEFWWVDEGLWLPGKELRKGFRPVPFSAAFVFPAGVRSCLKPRFNDTTDRGEEFTLDQLRTVIEEISRLGAKAYLADGGGLQGIFAEDHLYDLVQRWAQSLPSPGEQEGTV